MGIYSPVPITHFIFYCASCLSNISMTVNVQSAFYCTSATYYFVSSSWCTYPAFSTEDYSKVCLSFSQSCSFASMNSSDDEKLEPRNNNGSIEPRRLTADA